jgi:hypothetical protein
MVSWRRENLVPPEGRKSVMRLPKDLPQGIRQELEKRLPVEVLESLPEPPHETDEMMIATVAGWIALIERDMTVEVGQRRLRDVVRRCVRAGTLPTIQVIRAAGRYRDIDLALREMIAEGLDTDLRELARTSLKAFQQEAVLRDITTDPPGHNLGNHNRDIAIAILVALTLVRWPYLKKSQGRISKKTSASYIVAKALERRKIVGGISPDRVVEIYNEFDLIAERLAGLIPA